MIGHFDNRSDDIDSSSCMTIYSMHIHPVSIGTNNDNNDNTHNTHNNKMNG